MKVYEKDGIVYADNPVVAITVQQVRATADYHLLLRFSTGECKVFDTRTLIELGGVFQRLANVDLFLQAYVDYGTVVWNDEIDVAPEFLYDHAVTQE